MFESCIGLEENRTRVALHALSASPTPKPPALRPLFCRRRLGIRLAADYLEIAARQVHAPNEHRRPRDKPLRLADVKQMFLQMGDHA
jgi:hypothetical protein